MTLGEAFVAPALRSAMIRAMDALTIFAAVIDYIQPVPPMTLEIVVRMAAKSSFLWVPLIFIAYALGRRKWGLWFLFAFTASEAIAVFVARWIWVSEWNS